MAEDGLRKVQAMGWKWGKGCPGCDMGAGRTAPGFEQHSKEAGEVEEGEQSPKRVEARVGP